MSFPGLPRSVSSGFENKTLFSWPGISRRPSVDEDVNAAAVPPSRNGLTGKLKPPPLLELRVQLVTGRTAEIYVAPEESVVAVKLRLKRIEGLDPRSQRLICQGRELRDSETVSSFAPNGGGLRLMTWPSDMVSQRPMIDEDLLRAARAAIAKTDASTAAPLLAQLESDDPNRPTTPTTMTTL